MAFKSLPTTKSKKIHKPNAGDTEIISHPPSSPNNPFWSQAVGKPWNPAAHMPVQGGPVTLAPGTPRPTAPSPGLTGGTPAPPAAGGGAGSSGGAGAPPFSIPLVPADEEGKATALTGFNTALGNLGAGINEQAFNLGDPAIMGQWGVSTVNPNSALAMAALNAMNASRANRDVRTNNNSYFSSFSQNDQGQIRDAHDRANSAAYDAYYKALDAYNRGVTTANETYQEAIAPYNRDEREQAIKNLPTPTVTSGSSPSQGTVPSTPLSPPNAPGSSFDFWGKVKSGHPNWFPKIKTT